MNHVQNAMRELMFNVPREVLEIAFAERDWRAAPTSLEDRIIQRVVRGRVLPDCNLVGGVHTVINTTGIPYRRTESGEIVMTIPPAKLGNATLISVSKILYLPVGLVDAAGTMSGMYGNMPSSALNDMRHSGDSLGAARRLIQASGNMPQVSTARVEILVENTIMITDPRPTYQYYQLECYVTNDPNLNNIHPRCGPAFSKLVYHAVRSYIYTHLLIQLDRGYLQAGQELSAIKAYHENCADSEDLYQEHRDTTWAKVAAINNRAKHAQLIQMQISPGL